MPRHLAVVLLVAGAVGLAACGSSSSSSSASGTPEGKAQLIKTERAITKAGSVHYVDVTKIGSRSETLTGDIAQNAAQETLEVAGQTVLQVVSVGGVAYVNTTATSVLQSSLSLSSTQATALTGKWISLASSDAPYSSIVQSLTIAAALQVYLPKASAARLGPTKTIAGVTVVAITSTSAPSRGTTEWTSLSVDQSTALPITASLKASNGKTTETKVATFTKWGVQPIVLPPPGATPYSSIAAG